MSAYYRCTLKTQEFLTKDFVVRSTHSIEHQKCKYCVGRQGVRIRSFEFSYSLQLKGCHKQHLIAIYVFFVEEAIDAWLVWQNIGKKMGSNGAALTVA